jgi:hypothetical protein
VKRAPRPYMAQNPLDQRGLIDSRNGSHFTTTVGIYKAIYLVDFLISPYEGAAGSFDALGIWSALITTKHSGCISFSLNRGARERSR